MLRPALNQGASTHARQWRRGPCYPHWRSMAVVGHRGLHLLVWLPFLRGSHVSARELTELAPELKRDEPDFLLVPLTSWTEPSRLVIQP